jgi:hypothetical protein
MIWFGSPRLIWFHWPAKFDAHIGKKYKKTHFIQNLPSTVHFDDDTFFQSQIWRKTTDPVLSKKRSPSISTVLKRVRKTGGGGIVELYRTIVKPPVTVGGFFGGCKMPNLPSKTELLFVPSYRHTVSMPGGDAWICPPRVRQQPPFCSCRVSPARATESVKPGSASLLSETVKKWFFWEILKGITEPAGTLQVDFKGAWRCRLTAYSYFIAPL